MGPRFERIPTTGLTDEDDGISISPLRKLEQALVRALPRSVQMLAICRLACQNAFPPGIDVQLYRYTDSDLEENEWWKDEDLFVVCIQRPNFHSKKGVIMLTPPEPTAEMVQAFDNFIGWSESQVFQCTQSPIWDHLQTMCINHGNQKPENSLGIAGIMHAILDVNQAKNLAQEKVQNNHYVRSLEDKDVAQIVQQWKWRAEHSEQVIRKCIKRFVSCGLFVEDKGDGVDKNEEDMASSVLFSPLGVFNILFTPEKHRRKGYGKIIMEHVAKLAAEQFDIHPMAEIESWNMASKKCLEKAGFTEVYHTKWFYYDPLIPPPS